MKNTKQKILDTAILLFNEKGYENVSLREIAREADTTIGNLTYHFKKKEDLVIAIVYDLHESFSFYFSKDLHGVDLLRDLLHSFISAEKNQENYPFYFRNINELVSKSEYFININFEFQKNLHDYYLSCLLVLQKEHIIRQSTLPEDLNFLAYSFTNMIAEWSAISSLTNNPLIQRPSLYTLLTSLMKPYLEEEYLNDLKR